MRIRVIAALRMIGPGERLETLQALCPDVAPTLLAELRHRYRAIHRRKDRRCVHALRWTRAGWVWAMYNGAREAGIGVLKTWAQHEAARHDRPEAWTSDDVEHARLLANATARPHGVDAPTPDAAWAARAPVGERARRAFRKAVAAGLAQRECEGEGPLDALERRDRDQRIREEISRALVAHGYVEFRRRRIPLPIYARRASDF